MKKKRGNKNRVCWAKGWSENDENAINLRWLDIRGEDKEVIVKANLIESLQKQADVKIS